MTLPLELGGIQDPDVRRAFETVSLRFPLHAQDFANDVLLLATAGTARKIAFGTQLVNAGSTANVSHGLGVAPAAVAAVTAPGAGNVSIAWAITAASASTFTLGNPSGVNSNAYWIAVG